MVKATVSSREAERRWPSCIDFLTFRARQASGIRGSIFDERYDPGLDPRLRDWTNSLTHANHGGTSDESSDERTSPVNRSTTARMRQFYNLSRARQRLEALFFFNSLL